MDYAKVDEDFLKELVTILGAGNVDTDPQTLEKYSRDETPLVPGSPPEVVVRPGGTEEVSRVLALANERKIPVTFRGQGTGLSCGAVPLHGGVLMAFERMNRILEIDEENLMAVLEAGVVLLDFRQEVEKRGLFYPADPGERTSAIGGNVATNAGTSSAVAKCGLKATTAPAAAPAARRASALTERPSASAIMTAQAGVASSAA